MAQAVSVAAQAAELTILREGVSLCGIVYSWEFFHAMATRLAQGTQLDVTPIEGGRYLLHHFKPGRTPYP